MQYHKMSVEETIKDLATDRVRGLTSAEANKRTEKYGANELEEEEGKSLWEQIVE